MKIDYIDFGVSFFQSFKRPKFKTECREFMEKGKGKAGPGPYTTS